MLLLFSVNLLIGVKVRVAVFVRLLMITNEALTNITHFSFIKNGKYTETSATSCYFMEI